MKTENPKFILKPNLKSAMAVAALAGGLIFLGGLILFGGGLFFGGAFIVPVFAFLIVMIITGIRLLPSYFNYKRIEYRFFQDRLEYVEGFLVINRHLVPYKKVTDIVLRKGIWNRMIGTGTVVLITAGSISGHTQLVHIDNPDEVYNHLQKEILKV